MTSLLRPVVNRFEDLSDDNRFLFTKTIRNFNKWYSYIIQIARMYDKELHKESVFTSYLEKVLPRISEVDIDLEGKLKLEFYKLEEIFKGDISLNPTVGEEIIKYNTTIVTEKPEDTDALLDEILNKINERVKGIFTEADKVIVRTLYNKSVKENKKLERYAKKNDSEVFQHSIYPEVFKKVAQECYVEQVDSFTKLFEDKAFYESVQEEIAKEVYKYLRSKDFD